MVTLFTDAYIPHGVLFQLLVWACKKKVIEISCYKKNWVWQRRQIECFRIDDTKNMMINSQNKFALHMILYSQHEVNLCEENVIELDMLD